MKLVKITRILGLLIFACLPALADFDEDGADNKPKSGEQWKAGNNEHLKSYQDWKAHNREFERFFAAKKYLEAFFVAYKSLNVAQAHAAPNHPATILSQSNLAQAESVGDEALYFSAPAEHPAINSNAPARFLNVLNSGRVLPSKIPLNQWRRCGRFRSFCPDRLPALKVAVRRYEETLAIQEKALGPNHPSLARNLLGLGDTYRNLKQDLPAKVPYERALVILERQGAGPKKMSDLFGNLAGVYHVEGDIKRSVLYSEKSLVLRMKLLGPNHPDLVGPLRNLSGLYVVLNRDKEAEKLERHAARIETRRR